MHNRYLIIIAKFQWERQRLLIGLHEEEMKGTGPEQIKKEVMQAIFYLISWSLTCNSPWTMLSSASSIGSLSRCPSHLSIPLIYSLVIYTEKTKRFSSHHGVLGLY